MNQNTRARIPCDNLVVVVVVVVVASDRHVARAHAV